jgi:hypothetical protein
MVLGKYHAMKRLSVLLGLLFSLCASAHPYYLARYQPRSETVPCSGTSQLA